MRPVKFGLTTTDHMYHSINPRSRVNLYFQKHSERPPALHAATVTVDQSLIKSRIVSKAWVNHLAKTKQGPASRVGSTFNWNAKHGLSGMNSQSIDNYNSDLISLSSAGIAAENESQDERRSQTRTQKSNASRADTNSDSRMGAGTLASQEDEQVSAQTAMQAKLAKFRTLKGLDVEQAAPEPTKMAHQEKVPQRKQVEQETRSKLSPEQYEKQKREGLAEFKKEICTLARKSLEKL